MGISRDHRDAVIVLRPPRHALVFCFAGQLVPQRERLMCSRPEVVKKPASRQSRVSDSRVGALGQGVGDALESLSALLRCVACAQPVQQGPIRQRCGRPGSMSRPSKAPLLPPEFKSGEHVVALGRSAVVPLGVHGARERLHG
jgi:hypothetical protein